MVDLGHPDDQGYSGFSLAYASPDLTGAELTTTVSSSSTQPTPVNVTIDVKRYGTGKPRRVIIRAKLIDD